MQCQYFNAGGCGANVNIPIIKRSGMGSGTAPHAMVRIDDGISKLPGRTTISH